MYKANMFRMLSFLYFQSSDTLFTAEGLGGSATSSAGGGSFEAGLAESGGFLSNTLIGQTGDQDALAWNHANIESCDNNVDEVVCPYATFQLSREQQLQLNQQKQQQNQQVKHNQFQSVSCILKILIIRIINLFFI